MSRNPDKKAPNGTLLIVDDEEDVIYSFRRLLADEGYELLSAQSGEEGVQVFREKRPDLVLMDVRMAGMDGLRALQAIRKIDPKALVIIMTAFSSTGAAIEAMKAGAYDYVLKPFDIEKIKRLLSEAMRSSESMKSVVSYQPLLSREDHQQGIIGKSEAMQTVYKEIGRVAARNIPVLISGETGTGKELVARAIYHHSDRHDKRFIPINCGAIPEQLLESELFGHERGSFTGAHARKLGKFEVADGGTIFLDEIGELPVAIQAKLLRALQEKEIERLGGTSPIKVDVRIIAATNRNLPEMIRQKEFREDLYYRLNVVNIELPPLSERKEDISLLAEYFVERFGADYGGKFTISKKAIEKMMNYSWPGNVRELENVIKNSLVRAKGQTLMAGDIQLDPDAVLMTVGSESAPAATEAATAVREDDDLNSLMAHVFQRVRKMRESGETEDAFDLVEECLVREALMHVDGNQLQAAKLLGITRSTLRKRMAKYGIQLRTNIEAKGN